MNIVSRHLPCPLPGCGSSDAYAVWEDGHGYCFSCKGVTPPTNNKKDEQLTDTGVYTYEYLPWRSVTKETMEFFGCLTKIDAEGKPIAISFPYTETDMKIRLLDKKDFYSVGKMTETSLFGMTKFGAGQAKAITITEGEMDALSVFQMLGSKWPVVSVRGSSSAAKDATRSFEYLNSFEKIYLAFDNDEVGQKAAAQVARLFDFNKVYHVKMGRFKDANEYLVAGATDEFRNIWWNADRYLPEGIFSSLGSFTQILSENSNKPSIAYPFAKLQAMSGGIRTGEIVLFTAMEGIGKTEVIRAIEHGILKNTDENVAIIHLEEDKNRALKGLAGYELQEAVHLEESTATTEEIDAALAKLVKRDGRLHLYSHFGSDDPATLKEAIRFLVAVCGCKYVFLDHITMIVTGLETDDERRVLDVLSTNLASMVHDLDFALIMVSHVNDDGKTRGSRNISKVANLWVTLGRDPENSNETVRNTTFLSIRKNRHSGRTGPAGRLIFDPSTFMLKEAGELPT